jgi:septal ring factor EnvC (AmiA/AmiB activator)
MNHPIALALIAGFAVLAVPACDKQDPKLVEKRLQQEIEIKELKGELALLNEKIKHLPEDQTAQLKEAEETLDDRNAEVKRLEGEVAKLEAQKKELEDDIAAYKKKYPVSR